MKIVLRTGILLGAVLPATSHAACTKAQVEWLESMGYSVDRAMAWCGRDAGPQPTRVEPKHEQPPPLPVVERRHESRIEHAPETSEAIKYAQLIGNATRVDDAGGDGEVGAGGSKPARITGGTAVTTGGTTTNRGGTTTIRNGTAITTGGTTITTGGDTTVTGARNTKEGPAPATEGSALADFSTKKSNGSNLVTAHIATAYAPLFLENKSHFVPHALGVDISAAIPAQSATLKDYGKQAMLTLDGGIVNIFASIPGYDHQKIVQGTSPRNFDRFYYYKPKDGDWSKAEPGQLLFYTKGGLGGRAIKTALEGNGYAGLATAYLGFGVDGPLLNNLDGKKDSKAGWVSLEAFGVANAGNKTTFQKLFGGTPDRSVLPSWAANFSITLPGQFYLTVGYYRALGTYGRTSVGGTTVLAFGYNGGPEKTNRDLSEEERVEMLHARKLGPP